MNKVLISGGSGLLGSRITDLLLENGVRVAHLSTRKSYKRKNVDVFYWNPNEGYVDEKAFKGVDGIIHLAGAGIADKRWTDDRKKAIIESRVNSSKVLMDYLNDNENEVDVFIGASAIGYYGDQSGVLTEEMSPGSDFMAHVCELWEDSYKPLPESIRKVIFRIGIVLSNEGGALPEMTKTLPFFVGVLGDGQQIYSWIHIDDLARLFIEGLKNEKIKGTFNAVAPNPVRQKVMAKTIAKFKNTISLPAPKFGLQLVLGEMSAVLFLSQKCSAAKVEGTGFEFQYPKIEEAIADLM